MWMEDFMLESNTVAEFLVRPKNLPERAVSLAWVILNFWIPV